MTVPPAPGDELEARVAELATGFALGELAEGELREFYELLRDHDGQGPEVARLAWRTLGMVTDLRNELYIATLRRSVAFFQKYSTGSLLSAIINDVERVQFAMSSVLAEFLQQFFTFLFTALVVVGIGRRLTWVMMANIPRG